MTSEYVVSKVNGKELAEKIPTNSEMHAQWSNSDAKLHFV
jgi:hypothetical protein